MRSYVLLAVISAPVLFFNLGGAHLWDVDEAIFAEAGKEMFLRGDAVVPTYNGNVFPDKPAMMYWLMISAFEVFGPSEFAARFWSAVFGLANIMLTCRLGTMLFSPRAGFYSGLALASCLYFNVISRAVTPDSFLVFFATLTVLLFVSGTAGGKVLSGQLNERNAPWAGATRFQPSWATYALMYLSMALAVLTKGPIGILLPASVVGLFLLVMRTGPSQRPAASNWRAIAANVAFWFARVFSPVHFAKTFWSMRPLTGLAILIVVAGPWYALVSLRTGGQWPAGFFGVHNFGRFLHPMEHHGGPIFYYAIAIAIGFFPWSVLAGPVLSSLKPQYDRANPWRPGYVLISSWIAVWIGFFSLAGTKLPNYAMPAYPALALFVGSFVDHWLRHPESLARRWPPLIWGTVALVGLGMIVGLPIAAHVFLHDDWILGAVGLLPLAAAVAGYSFSRRGASRAETGTLAVLGLSLVVGMLGLAAVRIDRYQDSPKFVQFIAAQSTPEEPTTVGSYHYLPPSFVFYSDRIIERCETPADARAFFDEHPHGAFLLTTGEQWEHLESSLPEDIKVVATRKRFLKQGSVVLLGRGAELTAAAAKSTDEGPVVLQ